MLLLLNAGLRAEMSSEGAVCSQELCGKGKGRKDVVKLYEKKEGREEEMGGRRAY